MICQKSTHIYHSDNWYLSGMVDGGGGGGGGAGDGGKCIFLNMNDSLINTYK